MADCIQSPDLITPDWLTEILYNRQILYQGRVIHIEKDCDAPFGATVCKLDLVYSDDASKVAPHKLFLKILPGSDVMHEHGKREIQFYQVMMDSEKRLPIPQCYHAQYDDHSGVLNLLLEDLSASHQPLEHELPPTEKQCYQLMDILAELHAYWWEHPQLGVDIGRAPTQQWVTDEFNEETERWRAFADFLGDRLLPSRRAIYARVIDRLLPLRLKRFVEQKNITLSHGDAHAWNFLYPKSDTDTPRLVDWEVLGVNIGAYDVAYLMTVFWHPERRKWLEQPLVRHYHVQLLKYGISDYTWDDCWYDYRLSVINLLFTPVWWWAYKTPAFLWWHRLERLMMAYEDLNCAELLD